MRLTRLLAGLAAAIALATSSPIAAQPAARAVASPVVRPATAPAKKVILLVGLPGSGKTTIAKRLSARLGAPMWTSGDVIRKTIAERGLPYTAANDRSVAEELARTGGEIGRRVAAEVMASAAPVAIVEGFRAPADLETFRQVHPDTEVVAIEIGADRRYQRMLARGRAGETSTAYLRDRDRAELRRGVRRIMSQAGARLRPRGDDLAALDRSLAGMLRGIDPKLADRYQREPVGAP